MIPEELQAALDKCAREMSDVVGHEVWNACLNVENKMQDAGIGIETVTTITVVFGYTEIAKP
ncbi:MAG: hypothetical protein IJI85_10210 [Clostridia bacterium]|nr:hypothetical protein [Lentisphaeria bacterium]MBR0422933.1 hypothetical protein [Clostridia bacterium]